MTQVHRLILVGCMFSLGFVLVGCTGSTSSEVKPSSNDIEQYVKDHPEILLEDELDESDEAELE